MDIHQDKDDNNIVSVLVNRNNTKLNYLKFIRILNGGLYAVSPNNNNPTEFSVFDKLDRIVAVIHRSCPLLAKAKFKDLCDRIRAGEFDEYTHTP